jgi:hypothetical protein
MYDADMQMMARQVDEANRLALKSNFSDVSAESTKRGSALAKIAAMRTPSCASIGRRMADVADEALKN